MPFHIENVHSEVTVADGDLPLSPEQIEKLVQLVCRRIEEKSRNAALAREGSAIERHVTPPLRVAD